MDALIVEVISRFGQVHSRHRLSTFPATLGRAPTCDVILDGTDVSALHARIERTADGGLELVDAGSTNGIRANRTRVTRLTLGEVSDVRLASAHLRLVSPGAPVPKTVLFRLSRLESSRYAALGLVAYFLVTLLEEWAVKAIRVHPAELLKDGVMVLVVLIGGWVFLWSLASRVAHGRSRMMGHFSAATFAFAGATLVERLGDWFFCVLRAGPGVTDLLTSWASLAVAGWMLFQHLARVVSWKPRRIAFTAAALIGMMGLLMEVSKAAQAAKYTAELPLSGVHLPPAFLLGPLPADPGLTERIAALQAEVDARKR